MIHESNVPTLQDFLDGPIEQVTSVAPASMVYAPGGTRRSAIFQNIRPWTQEYIVWAQAETIRCVNHLFVSGIQHVFLPLFMSGHLREINDLESELANPASIFISSTEMLNKYKEHGWQVKIIGSGISKYLQKAADTLSSETFESQKTLWWIASLDIQHQWQSIFKAISSKNVQSAEEAIRAVYGENIPLITLFLGFGKPYISPEMFPPLLQGEIQCYWSQQAGYSLTERQLRMILYDYAFLRNTWRQDKTTRAQEAEADRALWESEFILGLGRRVGPFWYPDMNGYPQELLP